MRTVIVNSRGQVRPTRLDKERRDITPVQFDFSLLLSQIDSYTIEGDMPVVSDSVDGMRVTVVLDDGQAGGVYDLAVIATGGAETRAATIQVRVHDREQSYISWPFGYWGYW